jgi:uncharacterized membrane protein
MGEQLLFDFGLAEGASALARNSGFHMAICLGRNWCFCANSLTVDCFFIASMALFALKLA